MNQNQLQDVYRMVDSIPFSRAKKNMGRDFADGVMMAELLHHFNPKLVELHNYPPANSTIKKIQNWNILNNKVFRKLGIGLNKQQIQSIVHCSQGVIEQLLYILFTKFEQPQDQGSLVHNAQHFDKRFGKSFDARFDQANENDQPRRSSNKKEQREQNEETEEILRLVTEIDEANAKLLSLREQNKLRDNIIEGLEKKIEKLIFE